MRTNIFVLLYCSPVIVVIVWASVSFYSNYQVCKQYYSKVSPLVCMMSTKTKLAGEE